MNDHPSLAMLIPWAVIEGPGGGVGRFAEALCIAVARRGLRPELFALWRQAPASEQRLRDRLAVVGVPLTTGAAWDSAHPYRSLAQAVRALRPLLRRGRFRLLHSHHEFGDLAAAALKVTGAVPRLMRTVHNEEWLWRPLVRHMLTEGVYPALFSAETGVSQEIVTRLDARPLARRLSRRAHLLHNAIDLERFRAPAAGLSALRQALGLPPVGPLIGSVGRLDEQKGYAGLLAAAPAVLATWPDARFILVGEGPLESALRKQAAALEIADRVALLGPRPDVEQVLRLFDVFVSSSLFEGLPTVVLESMAAGVPVVATAVSGSREVVEDGQNGLLVPPRDPARLADAVLRLLAHPELGRQLAGAAHATVQRFSIEAVAAEYAPVYQALLA